MILFLILAVIPFMDATDLVLQSLGTYTEKESYTYGEFRDYTYYDSLDMTNNANFTPLDAEGHEKLNAHLEDYQGWVDTYLSHDPNHEIGRYCTFDHAIIVQHPLLLP